MSQPLAQVLDEAEFTGPRGPDGRHEISVPESWMVERAWVELPLPRLLSCAACDGGGCDACDRSGAVATRDRSSEAEVVTLQLPPSGPAVLRLPRHGGLPPSGNEEVGRGTLLLTVRPGDAPSGGLRRLPPTPRIEVHLPSPGLPPGVVFAVTIGALLLLAWLAGR